VSGGILFGGRLFGDILFDGFLFVFSRWAVPGLMGSMVPQL